MFHKFIPYIALLWSLFWYCDYKYATVKADTANDLFAFIMFLLGWIVFIGWGCYAIWQIP